MPQKIRTDGIYVSSHKGRTFPANDLGSHNTIDTTFEAIYIFNSDGFFFSYIVPKGKEIAFDSDFYNWNVFRKGRFEEINDTIKLIDMDKNGQFKYELKRTYFVVIDSLQLRLIYFSYDDKIPTTRDFLKYQAQRHEEAQNIYLFREHEPLPESARVWMLNYKWFWCDEEEFKAYKRKKRSK